MLTSEDIKLLSQLMDEKLKPINERLDTIEENTEITDRKSTRLNSSH